MKYLTTLCIMCILIPDKKNIDGKETLMASPTEYTAFRIDTVTLEKLRAIATAMERSMAGQVRFMVDRELEEMQAVGLVEKDLELEKISK